MTNPSQPSTSAALARVDARLPQRALKTSIEDLDDDDLVEIGRAVSSTSPRRALSAVGGIAAVVAAPAIAWLSFPAAFAVAAVGLATIFVRGRGDAVADLSDAGFSPALADELGRAAAWVGVLPRADHFKIVLRATLNRDEQLRRGKLVVERVEGRRREALTSSSALAIAATDERAD